jgi:uncharacterized protein
MGSDKKLVNPEAGLGAGVGLRPAHFEHVLAEKPPVKWFECLTENFMGSGGKEICILEKIREDYPISFHGVSMNLGSVDPLNPQYLEHLKLLIDTFQPQFVSDHLCWTGVDGENLHDLFPLPYTREALEWVSLKIRKVQDFLGVRILIENVSSYVEFSHSEMKEWEFVSELCSASDCDLLLDVNNIFVNSVNHSFDPKDYLLGIPVDRVKQYHLAGHSKGESFLIDTHDHPVCDEVWEIFGTALRRFGPVSTLVEWDNLIPSWEILMGEAEKAQAFMETCNDRGKSSRVG